MRLAAEPKEIKVKTVERTLKLLEILAEQNTPLPLTRIGQIAKLSLSTTYRLLSTLCKSGFVEREKSTGHYKLGLKAFLIGNAAIQNVELRPIALPLLNSLAQATGESVYLSILSGQNVIYSDCIKTTDPIQIGIQTGIPVPACQTSSGKMLISNLPLSEQQNYAQNYYEAKLIDNPSTLLQELRAVRLQDFAAEISGLMGSVREISVPLYNHLRVCIGAISIFRPVNGNSLTEQDELLINKLKEIGREISRTMGFPLSIKA